MRPPSPARALARALALGACVAGTAAAQAPVTKDAPSRGAAVRGGGPTVWPDEGPRTWTARATVPAITANDLRTRLYQFADDSMRGRRIGEPGNLAGTEYIAREFQRLGLKPAGDGGTYFQVLPFGPAGYDRAASRLTVAGAALEPGREWIPTAPTGTSVAGTADFADLPTVYGGRWGDSTALDPAAVRGKVVVFAAAPSAAPAAAAAPALPSCDAVVDKFGAAAAIAAEAEDQRRGTGRFARGGGARSDTRAQAAGAAAVLVANLDGMSPAAVGAAFATRAMMQPAPAAAGALPAASIARASAERLFGRPLDQLAVGATGQPISGRWSHAWRPSAAPARNVIAVLPGSDPARAGEYVLVSAHNDHVGTNATAVDHDSLRAVNTVTRRQGANDPACRPTAEQQRRIDSLIAYARRVRPPRRDSIMNGADDDGSGTVVLLEIAERMAAERPARSIIFVSHNGEEAGLLGSKWFTDHPTVPLKQIVAAHNMDMVGKGRAEQVKFGGPNSIQMLGSRRLSREFGDVIDSVNANIPEPMAIDRSWDVPANPLNRFCRSDQVYYVLHDVPVTYFSLGYAQDYHQLTDEPQYVDYDHAARVGRFLHAVMSALANRRERPAITGADPAYPRCR
jgi:hypothetical protein